MRIIPLIGTSFQSGLNTGRRDRMKLEAWRVSRHEPRGWGKMISVLADLFASRCLMIWRRGRGYRGIGTPRKLVELFWV